MDFEQANLDGESVLGRARASPRLRTGSTAHRTQGGEITTRSDTEPPGGNAERLTQ
jgi:hypothetical protein